MRIVLLLLAAFVASWAPPPAAADPTAPVTVVRAPEDRGTMFSPGVRRVADIAPNYVEEEFFVSGAATLYTYNDPPARGELVPLEENVPYTTRIIVRRPESAADFNGTVIVEWWNSTATFDTAPVWDPSAEYFTRKGIAYVGVTNSTTSIDHLRGGCSLLGFLPPTCGTRYAALSLPENGLAFEMVSQIANLVKSNPTVSPLPSGFRVERLFHAGQSQQGGSMVTYASAFHFPANDGYFIQAAGTARPINFRPACGDAGSPPYPDCTPRLEGEQRLVRRDLPVPVYRAQTETDMARVLEGGTRQSDTALFRYYEMAGTAHTTVHENIEVIPAGVLGPDPLYLEDACEFPFNTLADGPIFGSVLYNAMWENMELQVRFGIEPPHGELMEVSDGQIVRDRFGNARGGIRLPQLDVPVATYGPSNRLNPALPPFLGPIGDLVCRLSGTVAPFDDATLAGLYPTYASFVKKVEKRAADLVQARFLLPEDVSRLVPPHVTSGQRGCIVAMNRGGAGTGGVLGRQNSDNERCVRSAGRGGLAGFSVSECVKKDVRFGVALAEEKLVAEEARTCLSEPGQLPEFGYPGDGSTPAAPLIAAVARAQSRAMLAELFGTDLDSAIIDRDLDRAGNRCQARIVKMADAVLEKMTAEGIRAMQLGLKDGSVLDAAGLAGVVLAAIEADERGRIETRVDNLAVAVADICLAPGVGLGNAFPGACAAAVGSPESFGACVAVRARCHACLAFDGIGGLGADCDGFDDGDSDNGSCG